MHILISLIGNGRFTFRPRCTSLLTLVNILIQTHAAPIIDFFFFFSWFFLAAVITSPLVILLGSPYIAANFFFFGVIISISCRLYLFSFLACPILSLHFVSIYSLPSSWHPPCYSLPIFSERATTLWACHPCTQALAYYPSWLKKKLVLDCHQNVQAVSNYPCNYPCLSDLIHQSVTCPLSLSKLVNSLANLSHCHLMRLRKCQWILLCHGFSHFIHMLLAMMIAMLR